MLPDGFGHQTLLRIWVSDVALGSNCYQSGTTYCCLELCYELCKGQIIASGDLYL